MPPRKRPRINYWIAGAILAVSVAFAVRGSLPIAGVLWTVAFLALMAGPALEDFTKLPRIPSDARALSPARWENREGTLFQGQLAIWLVPKWRVSLTPPYLVTPRHIERIREASILEARVCERSVTLVYLDAAEERAVLQIDGLSDPAALVERVKQGSVRVI